MFNPLSGMDPYNRTGAGPYPNTMGNLQGGGFPGAAGSMMGAGGTNMFDPRASFMAGGPGGFNASYMGGTMGMQDNRMMGIQLNNQNMNNFGGGPNHIQKGDIRALSEEQLKNIYRTQRVEPIVEVRIVYNEEYSEVKLTNIAEGDFPEWNEILEFPLLAMNKRRFTRQELINSKSMIYVTLFDREITMMNSGRIEIDTNYRYLGSYSIPLIAVLNNPPKIDAIFKVNRPLALFNYQVEPNTFFFLK
jgi:hypothetical protein